MLYELRVYTVTPGRLGDTLDRWRDLPAIFAKHGIDNVGRWYATAGPAGPNWVYLMAYRDFAERDAQWSAFYGDDAWWSLRTETNAGEEMTERFDIAFLRPNGVWQTPEAAGAPTPDSLYELTFAEIAVGQNAIANDYLGQTYVPLVARAGGRMMMLADFVAGPSLPKVAWIVAWPDAATPRDGASRDRVRRGQHRRDQGAARRTWTCRDRQDG